MKVKVSKVMAKTLNKGCHNMHVAYDVLSAKTYERLVDCDLFKHDSDFTYNDDGVLCVKVLRIVYPGECYAMPQYASTSDLVRIMKTSHATTIEELCSAFQNEYGI